MPIPSQAPAAAVTPGPVRYDLAEANRLLPYLRRIVTDIQRTYRQVMAMHEQAGSEEGRDLADDQAYQQRMADLRRFVDELDQLGVELKDYESGLVEFPGAEAEPAPQLYWRPGEESVTQKQVPVASG